MKRTTIILIAVAVFLTCRTATFAVGSLAPHNPITLLGNSVGYADGCIVYAGDTLALGPRTLFLDGSLSDEETVANKYVFNSFREAAKHLVDGTEDKPMRLLIAPWVYWVDDPDDPAVAVAKNGRGPFGITIRCHNLHLIGLNPDARNVVLASQRGQTQGAVGNFTMFDIHGDGLRVENLTMGNYCNVDLDFPMKPSLSRVKRSDAITQAHVGYVRGDRAVARNVRFISRLNMNPLNGARRILYDRCHMECTDDALTGNGVYLNCTIDLYGQKPFYTTHSCGAVFLGCDFKVKSGNRDMVFCKSPGPVTLIDCRYHGHDSLYVGWANYPNAALRCYQSGFTLNGKPYTVGSRRAANTVSIDVLPLRQAYMYKVKGKEKYNLYNLLSGDDGWDPTGSKDEVMSYAASVGDAERYNVACMPTALIANKKKVEMRTGDAPTVLSVTPKRHGGFSYVPREGDEVRWTVEKGFEKYVEISPMDGGRCSVKAMNNTDETAVFCLLASMSSGLETAVELTVSPSLLPAPEFKKRPVLKRERDVLRLDYSLKLGKREDQSEITWYRCINAAGDSAVAMKVSRYGVPEKVYELTPDDNGYHIMARIQPRHLRSRDAETITVVTPRPVEMGDSRLSVLIETDFSTFPTVTQPRIIPGFWTVDGHKPKDTAEYPWSFDESKDMWTYGEGFNGAVGKGLLQAQRGARLLYTPLDGEYGDMMLALEVDPTKTAGQGFGSATGQYMDVCIKFDTRTLTGYALRIIRTVKHAKAVDFLLVEYRNGETRALTKPISAICYRTGCTITMMLSGNFLSASVNTTTSLPADSPLARTVMLGSTIIPNTFGGFGIQHTGTCGESTTMLHYLAVEAVRK